MPPRGYLAVIRTIDKFTEWTGYLFVLFLIPLILSNVIEVFARYVLKQPTIWALDITTMSYAALFMLGSAVLAGIGLAGLRQLAGARPMSNVAAAVLLVVVNIEALRAPFTYTPFIDVVNDCLQQYIALCRRAKNRQTRG